MTVIENQVGTKRIRRRCILLIISYVFYSNATSATLETMLFRNNGPPSQQHCVVKTKIDRALVIWSGYTLLCVILHTE